MLNKKKLQTQGQKHFKSNTSKWISSILFSKQVV